MCDMYIAEYCESIKPEQKRFVYFVVDTNENKSNGTILGRFQNHEDAESFFKMKLNSLIFHNETLAKGYIKNVNKGNILSEAWMSYEENFKRPDICVLKLMKVETI